MIICDDEPNTREGLRDSFPWAEYGVECIGVAADGETGLDLALETRPDFILTDVRMPFMDGIELARVLREQKYRGKIAFISAYDDVSYLRSALRVEAVDYLVKPVATRELADLTVRITAAIMRERERDELFKQGLSSLREKLFRDLIYRKRVGTERLAERVESLELNFPVEGHYVVLACRSDEAVEAFTSLSERERALVEIRLRERLRLELERTGSAALFEDREGSLAAILRCDERNAALEAAERFRAAGPLMIGGTVSIGVGPMVSHLGDIANSYLGAVAALGLRDAWGGDSVFDAEEPVIPERERVGGRAKQVANRVDEILRGRYAENLTIKDIAKEVYLAPTYLCQLYKQETGETINEALTKIRIDRAKEALRDFRKKAYEVCYEVGYADATHFARTFKRLTGMSPSSYRNSAGNVP